MIKVLKNIKLGTKMITVLMVCFLVLVGVMTWMVQKGVVKMAKDAAVAKAAGDLETGEVIIDQMFPGPWRREGDKLYKGDVLMNGNFEGVDLVAKLTGDTATIFCWDTRVATTVKKIEDGSRAVGTQVSKPVFEAVLKKGEYFYGEADVVGHLYQTAYKPIKDAEGNIVGIWYVGAPKATFDKMVGEALGPRTIAIAAAIGLVISLLVGIFFSRHVTGIIRSLNKETKRLVNEVMLGKLGARGDTEKINFEFRGIVAGINDVINTLVGYINTVPNPVMVIDNEFNIQYLNQAGLDLIGATEQQVIGTKCYNHFKTDDCQTVNCACTRAMQSAQKTSRETDAHPRGMNFNIAYTGVPVKDANGKVVGAMEVIVDQTAIKNAARIAQKQAAYQEKEVEKLIVNLEKLAVGDLQIETSVAATDEDTKAIGENFAKINESLRQTIKAVNLVAQDANRLAEAAVEGKLDGRADASRHGGEFRNIIEGFNKTLDAVVVPVNEVVECLKGMAGGNLDVVMTGDYKGDYAVMKNALNTTVEALNEILGQVAIAVDQVAGGSQQISSSSQALSQGASESASTLEETTSSMQQVTAQTKQNAENATQANQLATQTRASAEKGNEQMSEMVNAMNEINESATNISKIIKAIDEIAFQTNLLALNAAVEAARAGKHGKGFAVVAEEVRNLAERSARAAKETAEMIEGSIKKTEVGTRIAEETAKALEEIVLSVTKVTDLIGEIASASKEQALGINQINQGLGQVDQVTQQNTASAQELAATAEELSSQAVQLQEMLGRFRLKEAQRMQGRASQAQVAAGRTRDRLAQTHRAGLSEAAATSSPAAGLENETILLADDDFGKF
ncbi:MAG: methyl-accepting chemotaxis protein [Bacillota bacterium]